MVMGGESCSNGREFESWHHILDGHFFTYVICCIICNVFEKTKINSKEAGVGTFLFFKNGNKSFILNTSFSWFDARVIFLSCPFCKIPFAKVLEKDFH